MDNNKTGGPAFPSAYREYELGMTLRDYFAAKAMPSIIGLMDGGFINPYNEPDYPAEIAKHSYAIADAMIAAREGGK